MISMRSPPGLRLTFGCWRPAPDRFLFACSAIPKDKSPTAARTPCCKCSRFSRQKSAGPQPTSSTCIPGWRPAWSYTQRVQGYGVGAKQTVELDARLQVGGGAVLDSFQITLVKQPALLILAPSSMGFLVLLRTFLLPQDAIISMTECIVVWQECSKDFKERG